MPGDEPGRIADAYGAEHAAARARSRRNTTADNLFRLNQNIEPAVLVEPADSPSGPQAKPPAAPRLPLPPRPASAITTAMSAQTVVLAGITLAARASGALWWPDERLLCVADLHLGKSERLARRGGALLPPYETAETLDRLAAEIAALAPARVVCLGDSFDDTAAGAALDAGRGGAPVRPRRRAGLDLDRRQPRPRARAARRHLAELRARSARLPPRRPPGRRPRRDLRPLPPQAPPAAARRSRHPPLLPRRRDPPDPARLRRLHRRPLRLRSPPRPPPRPRRPRHPHRRPLRRRPCPQPPPRPGADAPPHPHRRRHPRRTPPCIAAIAPRPDEGVPTPPAHPSAQPLDLYRTRADAGPATRFHAPYRPPLAAIAPRPDEGAPPPLRPSSAQPVTPAGSAPDAGSATPRLNTPGIRPHRQECHTRDTFHVFFVHGFCMRCACVVHATFRPIPGPRAPFS